MEKMDVSKEPAVKMRGEDLAHAYDAVRVANKSVSRLSPLTHPCGFCCDFYVVDKLCPLVSSRPLWVSGSWRVSCVTSAVSGRRSWRLWGIKHPLPLPLQHSHRYGGGPLWCMKDSVERFCIIWVLMGFCSHAPILTSFCFPHLPAFLSYITSQQCKSQCIVECGCHPNLLPLMLFYLELFVCCTHVESLGSRALDKTPNPTCVCVCVCLCVKELQELLEAREQECVRLRRELKELRNTVSLRRLLTQGDASFLPWQKSPN